MLKTIPLAVLFVGALALPALAQDRPGAENGALIPGESTPSGGGFQQLSPGNKMIAKSLFDAQSASDPGMLSGSGSPRWSLERIASERGDGRGWGEIFKDMKSEGLVSARNLGEVVSRYHRPPPQSGFLPARSRSVMITSATNDVSAISRARSANGPGGRAQGVAARTFNTGGKGVPGPSVHGRGSGAFPLGGAEMSGSAAVVSGTGAVAAGSVGGATVTGNAVTRGHGHAGGRGK